MIFYKKAGFAPSRFWASEVCNRKGLAGAVYRSQAVTRPAITYLWLFFFSLNIRLPIYLRAGPLISARKGGTPDALLLRRAAASLNRNGKPGTA